MELRFSFKNGHRKRLGQQRSPDHREHTIVRLLACTSKQCDLSNVRICESGKDSAVHAASRLNCGAVGPKKKLSGEAAHRSANMRLSTSNECICCSVGTALVKPATACHASPSSCSSAKGTTWAGATIASEHRVHTRRYYSWGEPHSPRGRITCQAKIINQRFYHTTFWLTITTAPNNLFRGKIPCVTGKIRTLVPAGGLSRARLAPFHGFRSFSTADFCSLQLPSSTAVLGMLWGARDELLMDL